MSSALISINLGYLQTQGELIPKMPLSNVISIADSGVLQWQQFNYVAVAAEDKAEMALCITTQFKTCCS